MKKNLFLFIALITFGFVGSNMAQEVEVPLHQPIHPISKTLGFTYEKQKKYAEVEVPEIDAKISIGYLELEIEEIEVITGAYDAKVTEVSINRGEKPFAKYSVSGHPNGPFSITFTDLDENTTADVPAGRQKNRRVEMTIIFEG